MGVYQEVMETAKSAISAALEKDRAFTSKVCLLVYRCNSKHCMLKYLTRHIRKNCVQDMLCFDALTEFSIEHSHSSSKKVSHNSTGD